MQDLVKIPEIVFVNSLKSHVLYELLQSKIIDEIKKIPNLTTFRLNNQITELVCTLIENSVKKKDKVDKKKLVCQILTVLFTLTAPEQLLISNQIEYMLDHDLVKKIIKPLTSKVYNKLFKKK